MWLRSKPLVMLLSLATFNSGIQNGKLLAKAFSVKAGPQREIHRTIKDLRENGLPLSVYQPTTDRVVKVLERWSEEYQTSPEWKSLLNKGNLRAEVEESIVALHHLHQWRQNETSPFIALDACCGKGVFSTLLSYLAPPGLTRIILLDKDPTVNWQYMELANQNNDNRQRPFLEMWPGTNLHEHDALLDKLLAYDTPIAITGIHLCRNLSPTLVGIVNALGPQMAPYLCLAPCCLPRKQQQLAIAQYEPPLQRQARLSAAALRARAKQPRRGCYVCHGNHHVRDCPQRQQYSTEEEWNQVVEKALLELPCWNCGQLGHRKEDCAEPTIQLQPKPQVLLEMASFYPSAKEPSLKAYCGALADALQHKATTVVDSNLTMTSSPQQGSSKNWNEHRKSLFVVATS